MTILQGDLIIMASESMDDSASGGGGLAEKPIVDGQSNNIFKDISTLKRTYGGVNLAKIFAAIRTSNADTLLGAFMYIDKIPGDKKLSVNLFSTGDHYDIRTDAAARVENYRAQGGKYLGYLYGTQYKGSQTVTLFQIETAPTPATGEVLLLKKVALDEQQYIRVVSVATTTQTFTDATGQFRRKIVTLGIATPLLFDFPGLEVQRFDTTTAPTNIYMTTIANAARYYSSRPLKTSVASGNYTVTVDSIYSQVVPSSQSEMALTDLTAAGSTTPLIAASNSNVTVNIAHALSANVAVYLGRAVYPGTLTMVYSGGQVHDVGGELMIGSLSVGTVNYASGVAVLGSTAPSLGTGVVATFKPAGVPITVADTDMIPITDASRAFMYTFNINPPPQPGALSVSYMAGDNWYELRDNGSGNLVAVIDGTGAGTINSITGSGTLTTAALPDVGSSIILAWGKKADYTYHAGGAVQCSVSKQLAHDHIVASSFVISWTDAQGTSYSMTSNSAGVLSGAGTGQLSPSAGFVKFIPTVLPAKGTTFHFDYQFNEGAAGVVKIQKTVSDFDLSGHTATLNLHDTNIVPGTVAISWELGWGSTIPTLSVPLSPGEYLTLPKIASGVIKKAELDNGSGGLVSGRSCTINYSTGIIELDWFVPTTLQFPNLATRYPNTSYIGVI